jgi:uncharacterized protein
MPVPDYKAVLEFRPYKTNYLKPRRIGSRYLIVGHHGSYASLTEQQYCQLQGHRLDDSLFSELEEKGIILTEKGEQAAVEGYRKRHHFLTQGASLHIVVVTLRCNQVCVYCHAASRPENQKGYDMTRETARQTVDFIFQSPSKCITIEFQGGEPLLNFDIVRYIVDYANKKNKSYKKDLQFSLVTNLTLLTEDILNYFVENNVGICTSIDPPKEVHDRNRRYLKGPGTYDDVEKKIKELRKYPINPHALMVTTKRSFPYHREIVDEHIRLGFKEVWVRWTNNLGFAQRTWKELRYAPEEFVEFYKKVVDYIVKGKLPIREQLTTYIVRKIMTGRDPNYLDLRSPCGAAIGQLAYNHDGSVYSCDEGRMVEGDIFRLGSVDQSYKDILTSNETCSLVASSVNDIYMCNSCAYKPFCGLCPVCNYATKQNIVPILSIDDRCKILKAIFDYVFEKLIFEDDYAKAFSEWIKRRP